jgi:hypothetical protein
MLGMLSVWKLFQLLGSEYVELSTERYELVQLAMPARCCLVTLTAQTAADRDPLSAQVTAVSSHS